jgi:hypothetical protein
MRTVSMLLLTVAVAALALTAEAFVPSNTKTTVTTMPSTKWGTTSRQLIPGKHSDRDTLRQWDRNMRVAASVADMDTTLSENGAETTAAPNKQQKIGTVIFLIPSAGAAESVETKFGGSSPWVGRPSVLDAVTHIANKCSWWSVETVDTSIVPVPTDDSDDSDARFQELCQTDIVLALGLSTPKDIAYAKRLFEARRARDPAQRKRQCHFLLDSAASLPAMVGPYDAAAPSLQSSLLPWTQDATGRRFHEQMLGLFDRWTSDDFAYALMIFFNQFSGSQVDWVKHSIDATWEKGPVRNAQELYMMVDTCGDCITECVKDDKCRECIGKLAAVDTRDQVASYRTIVSYESKLLTDFTFCIMQKNNIFNCDADIPVLPKVAPIATWRGNPLTEEVARSILVGHLDDDAAPEGSLRTDVSWKVAFGANVAYDQFPSQNQLFYPAARGRDMWYDPVFRVETLDGESVWCKRHYKVRPGAVPGTFKLSVLDNGITSNEFWTIAGVAEDLSWTVLHYAGAAGAVGQRYIGGLLCTPDGAVPPVSQQEEIWKVFKSAGIQPWDLYKVDNDPDSPKLLEAGAPPLDFFRSAVLANRAKSD